MFSSKHKNTAFSAAQPVFKRLSDGFNGHSRLEQSIQELFYQHAAFVCFYNSRFLASPYEQVRLVSA